MGDSVTIAAFKDVADCDAALSCVETALRQKGLVEGVYDPEAILVGQPGQRVLRPGPKAPEATAYGDGLRTLLTNGVRFAGPRYFNGHGLGFSDWFCCPSCGQHVARQDPGFRDFMVQLGMAAWDWSEGRDPEPVVCPLCGATSSVLEWTVSDPVFLADLAVEFWNWPYIDPDPSRRAEWWHVDIVGVLESAVGCPAQLSGHKI